MFKKDQMRRFRGKFQYLPKNRDASVFFGDERGGEGVSDKNISAGQFELSVILDRELATYSLYCSNFF